MNTKVIPELNRLVDTLTQMWQKFFFGPIEVLPLSAFRVFFGASAFVFYSLRLLEFPFLFSEKGILPYKLSLTIIPPLYQPAIPLGVILTPSLAFGFHILFLIGLLALTLGVLPRIGIILTFVLHLAFVNRNPICVYGADQVACCILFFLCFTRSNDYLSILPLKSAPRPDGLLTDSLSTMGYRLVQIQICVIYAYSGLSKAQGHPWWAGDALWDILANGQLVSINFSFLKYFTIPLTLMTYVVIFWETYFSFLIWNRFLRAPTLAVGVLLHALIGLTMGIPFFSLFMISTYLLWISPERISRWIHRFRRAS